MNKPKRKYRKFRFLCCVENCKNDSVTSPGLNFHRFPSATIHVYKRKRREDWIAAVKRINPDGSPWQPGMNSRICSEHFVGNKKSEDPRSPSYNPTIFPAVYQKTEICEQTAIKRYKRVKKKTSTEIPQLPSTSHGSCKQTVTAADENVFHNSVQHKESGSGDNMLSVDHTGRMDQGAQVNFSEQKTSRYHKESFICIRYIYIDTSTGSPRSTCDVQLQVDMPESITAEKITVKKPNTEERRCETDVMYEDTAVCPEADDCDNSLKCTTEFQRSFGVTSIKEDRQMLDLAGVTLSVFQLLLEILPESNENKISRENCLLIFLLKMKCGLTYGSLGVLFGVRGTTIRRIFISTLQSLAAGTQQFVVWPGREIVPATMPQAFKETCSNSRVIIDCMEFRVEQPSTVDARVNFYSQYKKGFTMKVLVGCTPSGAISFVSKCYGGRTTDAQITSDARFLELLEPNDIVLPDKGLPQIKTEMDESGRGVSLVMPPFLDNKTFSEEEVNENYKVASAEAAHNRRKAHAERAKERGDDKWILPSVEAKLSSNDSGKKKKKKVKKEKREKKAKKSKKKKKRRESSSSSDSTEDEGEQWVEKGGKTSVGCNSPKLETHQPEQPLERDEWMNLPGSFLCSAQEKKQKKNEAKTETCILTEPGQSRNELNPYWKDGGTGLPETEEKKPKLMDVNWLKKALQRAKEQAVEEGKTLEEIASERWGSLDAINSMIEESERNSRRMYGSEKHSKNNYSRNSFSGRDYDHKKSRRSDDDKVYERRGTDHVERGDRSSRRERDRSRSRDRSRRRSRDRVNDRELFSDRKKLAFRKPDEHEPSSSSAFNKSSSAVKRWQKPEVKERIADQRKKESQAEKLPSRQSEKSDSDQSDSSNDEKMSGDDPKAETDKILTDAELNRLGALIVKAEIMGDTELAMSLKTKLETARESRKNRPAIPENKSVPEEENVVLMKVNARGMAKPLEPRSEYQEPTGGRRKAKKVGTHESGQRVRYFADDDKFTLQEMFQREKGQTSVENDATFVKMASKSMDMDELFEQRITREESDAKLDERDRTRAIADHQKHESIIANCNWCFDSKKLLKHMIVAMGEKCYVSLPPHASLTTGHCILTPVQHVSCQTQLDEDVWEELQNFKKAITKMFMDKNEFPVFFELFAGQHRYPHMQLECVPLPDEVGSMAPIYFKKALLECEMEWSTNKKVVDLSTKNVRESIPKGLPYFAVSFGNHGGFAHVIEDEKLFPKNFAQEIIGGILDLDHSLWRKPRRENFDQQRKKVLQFSAAWKPYDFTVNDESS